MNDQESVRISKVESVSIKEEEEEEEDVDVSPRVPD